MKKLGALEAEMPQLEVDKKLAEEKLAKVAAEMEPDGAGKSGYFAGNPAGYEEGGTGSAGCSKATG